MRASPTGPQTESQEARGVRGIIFDTKRYAVHDGPGLRTTVFLKGCSLRCSWCHNPEAIQQQPEIFFHQDRCIACGDCVEECPTSAQQLVPETGRIFDRDICQGTGTCVDVCYSGALSLAGREVTAAEVLDKVRLDSGFYAESGGGVTLSGGEPLMQAEFATEILKLCKSEGLHTALDTCGQVQWRVYENALPFTDLVLYDVKHMSSDIHKQYTGVGNERIINNLVKISRYGVPIEIRMVMLPTINDSREFVSSAAELLSSLDNITGVRLLPYHRLAGSKYLQLGKADTMPDIKEPTDADLQQPAQWLRDAGLEVILPSS
jgi:pyruvate formate lyase activating enzyme